MEISLSDISKAIFKKWYVVIIIMAIFALCGFCIAEFAINKDYASASTSFVYPKATSDTAKKMSEVTATSHCIAQADSLQLYVDLASKLTQEGFAEVAPSKLKSAIKVASYDKDLNILKIKCTWSSPETAQEILTIFNEVFAGRMKSLPFSEQYIEVTVSEEPNLSRSPIAPNVSLLTIVAGLLGLIFAIIAILIAGFVMGRVSSFDNISEKLNLPVLGEIPVVKAKDRGGKK